MTRERLLLLSVAPMLIGAFPFFAAGQEALERATFRVKYVAQGAVYLDRGRAAGIKEGQELVIERQPMLAPVSANRTTPGPTPPSGLIATLRVVSVAESSAVCEIASSTDPVEVGDVARFAAEEVKQQHEEQKKQERLTGGRAYPQVISFTSGDPAVEEARAAVPRPPSPEINRTRGMIGVEYSTVFTRGSASSTSSEIGMVVRMDMRRIGGTYWDFNGYWRGRFTTLSGPAQPATITEMINRTYHLAMTYDNPNSPWVAGGGRLYLPWATSLDTIDGGYFGRRVGEHTIVGIFAGSTPDPTSYDYNPNQRIGGAFVNFSGGDFGGVRYTSTFGLGVSTLGWHANRDFLFEETGIFFGPKVALYNSIEFDTPHTIVIPTSTDGSSPPTVTSNGGLNRSYLTLRFQPNKHLEFNLNDTYFRDIPTFDTNLIGTGLLDKYLFQGISGGVRVNLPQKISVYTTIGQSSRTGDSKSSWNQLFGITLGEIKKTGIRADLRYSKFNSSFGSGEYKAISLSRSFRENFQWELLGGVQNFNSTLTRTSQTHFISTYLDWWLAKVVFFQAGYTWQRGGTMNYDQVQFIVGKRF